MASTNDGPEAGAGVTGGNFASDAHAETVEAARRTIDRAGDMARTAANSVEEALAREARDRPVTLFLAALAAGFILGRAL